MKTKMPYPRKRKPPVKKYRSSDYMESAADIGNYLAAALGSSRSEAELRLAMTVAIEACLQVWGSSESPVSKETGVRNLHPFADVAKL